MTNNAPTLDFIAIGRCGVDLYGEQIGGRLEDMSSFAKYLGGSPTNTAVGAARLGLRPGMLTRVGADHMGRFLRDELVREGVDVRGVVSDAERLTALVILGIRDRNTFPLIFYRENCADMALSADDIDEAWLGTAGAVLLSGTHLSKPNVFAASLKAAQLIKARGGKVMFDVDYRPVLWGLTGRDMGENRFVHDRGVTERLQQILPLCDLIVGTEEEMHILGGSTDTLTALRAIRERTPALLVCKLGAEGCVAFPGPIRQALRDGCYAPGFATEVYNVLGAGDAFMAGFLSGWLRGEDLAQCCRRANACGAIVVSRHGCAPAMPTAIELAYFLDRSDHFFRLRDDHMLDHIHWATTREGRYEDLTVLAMDHRSHFEEMAEEFGVGEDRITSFKALALRAIDAVASDAGAFGVLLDGRYGAEGLAEAAERPYWIGRPIEEPKSRPLAFEGGADVAAELRTWPRNHVVKCLVYYHPDDEAELRERQERQLLRLFDACRKTGHELLLEVILPPGMPSAPTTVAEAMRRLYAIGIRPDWWKLEPLSDPASWDAIQETILDNDPLCRGVLLLGLSTPAGELIQSLSCAAAFPIVKGFAVGRTIFDDVARGWLAGQLDDQGAVKAMASRFAGLADAWRHARLAQKAA
ncbi:bifunctional 5-dehydro-2-deoxygluconokinase/5-dehydro-2-deoxyphosphogluconate aldolase [Sphingomonas quercus]|uniref:5-dehydro-2-deoxygluconokinase n=1 Tax=Sphingomonas quercus TaxID=2842451 RepID=A0ABS6BGT3_9SPHN|nr:5-dehydro-2-deoxygluconokinase [Sphingomonas quercus]MBU3077507.1 5-dehydro-2-deoxygluconokinase [Sphingomonas quercus]